MPERSPAASDRAALGRSAGALVWRVTAAAAAGLSLAAFVRLPWAAGSGALAGREFSGPELARLARNTDVLVTNTAGRPLAMALFLALYTVPVAALIAIVLLAGASRTTSPTGAVHAAAACGLLITLLSLGTVVALLAGPGAGHALARTPGGGAYVALITGAFSCVAASRSTRPDGR